MYFEDRTVLVLECGSGNCRVGVAGDDSPAVVFPSIIGRARFPRAMHAVSAPEYFAGEEAISRSGILSLSHPIQRGIVQDWEGLQQLWDTAFRKLCEKKGQIHLEECPVVLVDSLLLCPKLQRERMIHILQQNHNIPAVLVEYSAVLVNYCVSKRHGLIIESGEGVTFVLPVWGGYALPHAAQRVNLAGQDVTECLMKSLQQKGYSCSTSSQTTKKLAQQIKEKLAYVALDLEQEIVKSQIHPDMVSSEFTLPDGQVWLVGEERFLCAELLFQPSLFGYNRTACMGIHELVYQSVMKCPLDLRQDLLLHVGLAGGNSLLPNLSQRLKKELASLFPPAMRIRMIEVDDKLHASWLGGSVVGSLSCSASKFVSLDRIDLIRRRRYSFLCL